ncbi:MAG: SH3 domain-containing protein [Bacteroidota bacterium]
MKRLFSLFILLISFYQGISQFIACEHSWAKQYQITAINGANLRDGQSLQSQIIDLVPYQSLVSVCYENTKRESIEGQYGKWVKVFWNEKEGFVFDAYIEKKTETPYMKIYNPEMDLVNEWQHTSFSTNTKNFGLYRTEQKQLFELREIKLKKAENHQYSTPSNNEEIPIWVFNDLGLKEKRIIRGQEINKMIMIGKKLSINGGTLYGCGVLQKGETNEVENFTIDPYELRFQFKDRNQIFDQLLLKMKCWGHTNGQHGYEARAVVNFIGDLDGDSKDDLLITFQTSYKGWNYGLFSTYYAEKGKKFKALIIGRGSE